MTEERIIKRIDQMCEKRGEIEVKNVSKFGTYELIVPVYVGDDEFEPEQIATLEMEFSIDDEWPVLWLFPRNLLSDDDYNLVCETIMDRLHLL